MCINLETCKTIPAVLWSERTHLNLLITLQLYVNLTESCKSRAVGCIASSMLLSSTDTIKQACYDSAVQPLWHPGPPKKLFLKPWAAPANSTAMTKIYWTLLLTIHFKHVQCIMAMHVGKWSCLLLYFHKIAFWDKLPIFNKLVWKT